MNWTRRAFLGACGISIASAQSKKRPNILFILSDDHHFQAVGFAGNPHIQTPKLVTLAGRGVIFSNAISSSPQCAPSRGVLLTGLEPFRTGVTSNGARRFNMYGGATIVSQLLMSGYETTLIGKWQTHRLPSVFGFSKVPLWINTRDTVESPYMLSRGVPVQETVKVPNCTEAFSQAAVEYLESPRQRPFFLWLSYLHSKSELPTEAQALAQYKKKNAELAPPLHDKDALPFNWRRYYSAITHLDEGIGKVIAALEKAGDLDNTVIFFCGANGNMCGSHGKSGKVYPWEASIRVPMLVSGAGVRGGIQSDQPVSTADFPATWLDLAQVKPATPLAGRSLKATLETGKTVSNESYAYWCDPVSESSHGVDPYRIIRTRTHKLILWESGEVELYDWPNDPEEKRNLISDPGSQKVLGQLKRKLEAHMADRKDPMLRNPKTTG